MREVRATSSYPPEAPPPADCSGVVSASRARRLHMLVVEDEPDAREALVKAIRAMGHDCRGARGSLEGLAMQKREPADVILSDWLLPGMDGLELCRRTRVTGEQGTYTYFIVVTAFHDHDHYIRAMEAGADDYFEKPVQLDELQSRLVAAARVLGVYQELAEKVAVLRRDSQRSFRLARLDPLTQVANRLSMDEDLIALWARAKRYGHRYSIAMCDIDRFKAYNDGLGHLAGDGALRRVAAAMRDELREGDGLYRYGGEEFVILLPEQGLIQASRAMTRVCDAVRELGLPGPRGEILTVSIGIAELDPSIDGTPDDWLGRADVALYQAKEAGRDRVRVDHRRPEGA